MFGRAILQTKERRALLMYVTYSELFQLCTFIVVLVSLWYPFSIFSIEYFPGTVNEILNFLEFYT